MIKMFLSQIMCEDANLKIQNSGDEYGHYLLNNILENKIIIYNQPQHNSNNDIFIMCGSTAHDSIHNNILCGCGLINYKLKINDFKDCYLLRGKLTLEKAKDSKPEYDFSNVALGDPG